MGRSTHTLTDAERALIATDKYQARFWAKVEKRAGDGCWLWTGCCGDNGYGQVRVGYAMVPAHRVAWEMVNGPIPEELWALHDCDRRYPAGDKSYRRCVRPDHLFLGTAGDNSRDAVGKGRAALGDRNGSRVHPDRVPRGERHSSRTRPDSLPRGDRNGMRTHPESVIRGDAHPFHRRPELRHWGERSATAILTTELVREIRASYIPRHKEFGAAAMARKYHVHRSTIERAISRKGWPHVE
jgi:hypothetical protein